MDPQYLLQSVDVWERRSVIVPSEHNFITPAFPVTFWDAPVFHMPTETAEARLAVISAQRAAAAAALENSAALAKNLPAEIGRRIEPVERQLQHMQEALAVLDAAETAREESSAETSGNGPPDAAGPASKPSKGRGDAAAEVQIVRNDPPLRYDTNLPVDLLHMVYAGRGAGGSTGVVFGPWYRMIQDRVIADYPSTARTSDFRDGRMSRSFMTAAVLSLQSCGQLYVGQRQYSALECAVLCLYMLHRATEGSKAIVADSFDALLPRLPALLNSLAAAISSGGSRPIYRYRDDKLPAAQMSATAGRYERGALSTHIVVATLLRAGVLPAAPGEVARGAATIADPEERLRDDGVNRAAAALLGRGHNLFLWEDQPLLRAAVNTITGLSVLHRLLFNSNVYSDRLENRLQLGMLIPGAVPAEAISKGASGADSGLVRSGDNNFEALCAAYVAPLYQANRGVELTQLFPGLSAFCLDAQASRGGPSTRRVLDISAGNRQAPLVRLTALELTNRARSTGAAVGEVLEAHDALALQYEQGLAVLAQQSRGTMLGGAKRQNAFNIGSDYDLLYFLCLGFIPQYLSMA
ncbi:DNA packaging tegument protein UL25 [Leporid alphaherpesvirus 4]|uniref:DNA packaging tegument protein UL25 n=1 Tax=Leporid alphaherpesvirus 4 TaxID=481315 RepID=J9R063_9ALPH|nr:DNA packaging tegument protein UL25 [Leporid alphaherpesvirus 4]AFR32467.1 DNA packaging tegument protein UL25 [Leporid alphaherpesvirus 4]